MMLAMSKKERFATAKEVREALRLGWKEWHRPLLRLASYLTHRDKTRALELVDRAVEAVLREDGRKWPIERVPSLRTVLMKAVQSLWLNDMRQIGRLDIDGEQRPDEMPDWTRSFDAMNATALRDEEVATVLARAREILARDESGLAVLEVLEDGERDEAVLLREARRTGRDLNDVVELARRRMGRALQRAFDEMRKS